MMLIIVWVFNPEFTALRVDSVWTSFVYWSTQSAGKWGTLIIIIVTSFLYAVRLESFKERLKKFLLSVVCLFIVLGGFAFLNENFVKKAFVRVRPSHSYLFNNATVTISIDSVYQLEDSERSKFFQHIIQSDTVNFKTIDSRVLNHWIEESGNSFPSGHTFNAFMLASIIAFSLYYVKNNYVRKLYFLPFVWAAFVAISRVAIGAHSAWDVSFGAALGIILSHLLIYFDLTRPVVIHKRHIA